MFAIPNNRRFIGLVLITGLAAAGYFSVQTYFKISRSHADAETFANFTDFSGNIPAENICRITDYGAVTDTATEEADNTEAIRRAIEDCSSRGGGQVVIPAGFWRTGPIHLKSRIDLHLDADAELVFRETESAYLPVVFTRFQGIEVMNYSPFIYAKDCEDISISGSGNINGHGRSWQDWKDKQSDHFPKLYEMAKNGVPVAERIFGDRQIGLRPSLIQFISCRNVKVSGISIENSPMWAVHPVYSENVLIDGITIDTEGHNSDGIVIDSSSNVTVRNCLLETGDDAIAIKSGLDHDGRRVGRPSENILIEDTRFVDGHSAIAIGSEMSGGVRNVLIRRVDISRIDQGVRIKSAPERGGFIENIRVEDASMEEMENSAFEIILDYESDTVINSEDYLPIIRNIRLDRISVDDVKYAIRIIGIAKLPIEDIHINSFSAKSKKGVFLSNVRNVSLIDVSRITASSKDNSLFTLENAHDILVDYPACDKKCFNFAPGDATDLRIRKSWFWSDRLD